MKDYLIVGLKSDGTVVAVFYSDTGCDVEGWTDIIAVSTGNHHTVGLKADGTVVVTADPGTAYTNFGQFAVGDWQGIVAVIAGGSHTVGLKADGTLVSTAVTEDYMDHGQTAVSEWSDIKLPTLKIR